MDTYINSVWIWQWLVQKASEWCEGSKQRLLWGCLHSLIIFFWVAPWFLAIRNWFRPQRRMLSNHTMLFPLGIIFVTLWISSEIFSLLFGTVKPSVTSCGGDVRKFIAPAFNPCSLLLVLDLLHFHCAECHLVLWQQQWGQSTCSDHWEFYRYQRHPPRVVSNPSSLFYSPGIFSHPSDVCLWALCSLPSPFPKSLFLPGLMLCFGFVLCRDSCVKPNSTLSSSAKHLGPR